MALNPTFKNKIGANWETQTNYTTPTPVVVKPVVTAPVSTPSPIFSQPTPTSLGQPVATTPTNTYNFTQSPQVNANAGNNSGMPQANVNMPTGGIPNNATKTVTNPVNVNAQQLGQVVTPPGTYTDADIARMKAEWEANNKLNAFDPNLIAQLQGILNPPKVDVPTYANPYASQMAQGLTDYMNALKTPTNFNPETDPALQAAKESGINTVNREFARKNMLGSMGNEAQAKLLSSGLVGQYQDKADKKRQQDIQNLASQLGLVSGLENQGYNRYRDTVGDVNTANTQAQKQATDVATLMQKQVESQNKAAQDYATAKGMVVNPETNELEITQDSEIALKKAEAEGVAAQQKAEKETYGVVLSSVARNYMSSYDSLKNDPNFQADIRNNSGNLALLRDAYAKNNDVEGANAVEGARLLKILNDPALREKYGASEFGLVTSDIKNKVLALEKDKADTLKAQLELAMKQIDYANYDVKTQMELEKANKALQGQDYDNFIKSVNASFIESEKKQDLNTKALQAKNIISQINDRATRTDIALNAEARASTKETEPTKSEVNKDFADNLVKVKGMSYDEAFANLTDAKNMKVYISNYGYDGYVDLYNTVLRDAFKDPNYKGKIKPLSKQ